jgi:hypothetical protein
MIGRGTRRHPDKADLLVLDVVGASAEHSLVTVPSLFGLPAPLARQAGIRGVADLAAEHEAAEVAAGRLRAEEVELFHALRDAMAWVATHRDGERRRYALGLGRGQTIILAHVDPDRDDGWGVQLQVTSGRGREQTTQVRTLLRDAHMETCQAVGEEYARRHGTASLVDTDAPWRAKRPSQRQRAAAHKWHLRDIDSYRTAGELSDALSAHIERVRARRRGA